MKILISVGIALIILYILFRLFKAFVKWTIIIILIFLAIAFFTNPSDSSNRESLKNIAHDLKVKRIREKLVDIDDYKIFSLIKVKVNGEEKIVGIGAFGKVWFFNDLEQRLSKGRRINSAA